MALANATAVSVAATTWTTVVSVTGDGTKQFIGAVLKCDDLTVAFEMRVLLNGATIIAGINVPAGQAGVIYDAPTTIPNTQALVVQAYIAAGPKNFTGTLLGS